MKNDLMSLRSAAIIAAVIFVSLQLAAYNCEDAKRHFANSTIVRQSVDEKGNLTETQIGPIENPDYSQPLCVGDKIILTAKDGGKVILRQVNPYYTQYVPEFIKTIAVVMCENETHILYQLACPEDYFTSIWDYLPMLEKDKDFKNVTAYKFSLYTKKSKEADIRRYHPIWGSNIIWLDKNSDEYCGSLYTDYIIFGAEKSEEGKEYYNVLGDLYLYYAEKFFNSKNNVDMINTEIFLIPVRQYDDSKKAQNLIKKYDKRTQAAIKKNNKR